MPLASDRRLAIQLSELTELVDDSLLVARVVPNVTGLDKQFDYLVPEPLREQVAVGSLVRVPLHGRRVGGWVVSLGAAVASALPVAASKLLPLAKWSSVGPSAELVELARWAAPRWGTDRLRPFLVAASPPTMVARLPGRRRTVAPTEATTQETKEEAMEDAMEDAAEDAAEEAVRDAVEAAVDAGVIAGAVDAGD